MWGDLAGFCGTIGQQIQFGTGGLVNRVTKKPTMEGVEGSVAVTGGSYGERRLEADTSGSWFNNALGGRLTGAGEYTGSQRHYYYMNRYAFAPTLRWRPSENTDMYVQVERLRDERLPDRGIAAIDGPQGVVPIGNYYGYILGSSAAPHDYIHEGATDETFDLRHDFQDGWHVHEIFRHAGTGVIRRSMRTCSTWRIRATTTHRTRTWSCFRERRSAVL